jgi:hypothetical protein
MMALTRHEPYNKQVFPDLHDFDFYEFHVNLISYELFSLIIFIKLCV